MGRTARICRGCWSPAWPRTGGRGRRRSNCSRTQRRSCGAKHRQRHGNRVMFRKSVTKRLSQNRKRLVNPKGIRRLPSAREMLREVQRKRKLEAVQGGRSEKEIRLDLGYCIIGGVCRRHPAMAEQAESSEARRTETDSLGGKGSSGQFGECLGGS